LSFYPSSIPPHSLSAIPSDSVGATRATLKLMVKFSRQYKTDVGVLTVAQNLVRNVREKDYGGEVRELYDFVKRSIRYLRDVNGVETVSTPPRVLQQGQGDCDDKSTLLATLLESIGHPARFVALGFKGGEFSHVIVETRLGSTWVPLDATVSYAFVGWYPPEVTRRMEAHI